MTPNEIAILLSEPLNKQFDYAFNEMVKARIKYWRSKLIKDALNKDPGRRKFFLQTLTLPLQPRKAVDCGIPLDCQIAETTIEVPTPITANRMLFEYVGAVTGDNAFTWVERAWLRFKKHDKYTANFGTYTWLNRKIQVHHNHLLPNILVEGVFDDPEQVLKQQCAANNEACDYGNMDFHAPGDILQLIVQSIWQVDLGHNQTPAPEARIETPVNADQNGIR